MLPTVRQLEVFVFTYRLGSVTAASRRMNITQSTASVLLRQFEHVMGAALFDRTTRVMSPTEAAHQALPFAERALRDLEQMQRATQALLTKASGKVRMAASAALSASVLPAIIARFHQVHPGVAIELRDVGPGDLPRLLLGNEVDFTVGGRPDTPSTELCYDLLRTGWLAAVRRREDGLALTMPWRELAREGAVIGIRAPNPIRRRIDSALQPLGIVFAPTLESELLSTVIALTQEGLGVAVLPDDLVGRHHRKTLTVQKLVNPTVSHEIVLATRRAVSLPPAATAFVDVMRLAMRDG